MLLLGAGPAAAPAAPAAPTAPTNPCTDAPPTATLVATTSRLGVVDLHFFGAQGARVSYFECVGARALPLGQLTAAVGEAATHMYGATYWRCGRLTRHFAATATLPDGAFVRGTSSAHTTSCAKRFAIGLPRRIAPGRLARVSIVDTWKVGGVRTKLCTISPRGDDTCRSVVFDTGATAMRRFRPMTRGRWGIELRVARAHIRRSLPVGVRAAAPQAAPPTVLATGDSTMEGIDSFLADDLGDAATVRSDWRPGFAISKDDTWTAIATSQVARLTPRDTVMSIGANEGFPMRGAGGAPLYCCDEPWVAEYARRLRAIMVTYRRRGRGRVFWLTLPAPRDAERVPTFAAVNAAILRAATSVAGVRILRMDLLFTPAGYRATMRDRGRDVRVRAADGIHLSVAGTEIAAREVVRALHAR
jgi:hypothetical protein